MTRIDASSINLPSVSIELFNILVSRIFLTNVGISVFLVMVVDVLTFLS